MRSTGEFLVFAGGVALAAVLTAAGWRWWEALLGCVAGILLVQFLQGFFRH